MKFFDFLRRKEKPIEKKKDVITNILDVINELESVSSLVDVRSLSFNSAINWYDSVGPLKKAINMIAKGFAQINFVLEDKNNPGVYETEHPVLDLINSPNMDFTGAELKKQIATFYLLLGNAFLEANGVANKPPLELFNKGPQFFKIEASQLDGFAQKYLFQGVSFSQEFFRDEVNRKFRFYSKTGLNELWHIRDFNAKFSAGHLFGTIPISSILIDIEQYARSSNHNLSLLKNGARLSAILMKEGTFSPKQRDVLKQSMRERTGDSNAGKMFLVESGDGKLDLKELSQSNKDMDFKDNKTDVRLEIYNHFDIPIPLISPQHMTLQNYKEAKLAFYDDAVLPLTDRLQEELTRFLFPRYPDLEQWKLSYNPQTITALLVRSNEDIKIKKDSGVLTTNEIRSLYQYEDVEEGDDVYISNSLKKLGEENGFTKEENDASKQAFTNILRKSGYTEDDIKAKIKKHFS